MAGVPRMTLQVQLVARALLEAGEAESYGLQLCAVTGLPSGTVYPIIARLEQAGWLDSWWEDPVRHTTEGRPRRRYYRLSQDGAQTARLALARSYRSRSGAVPGWGVAIPGGSGASS
jgi:DNA-binding PadR family transcriptional regulator